MTDPNAEKNAAPLVAGVACPQCGKVVQYPLSHMCRSVAAPNAEQVATPRTREEHIAWIARQYPDAPRTAEIVGHYYWKESTNSEDEDRDYIEPIAKMERELGAASPSRGEEVAAWPPSNEALQDLLIAAATDHKALRSDIARHVRIAAEQATEIARLNESHDEVVEDWAYQKKLAEEKAEHIKNLQATLDKDDKEIARLHADLAHVIRQRDLWEQAFQSAKQEAAERAQSNLILEIENMELRSENTEQIRLKWEFVTKAQAEVNAERERAERAEAERDVLKLDAERRVSVWMMERAYATGHGDTVEQMLAELEAQAKESERKKWAAVYDHEAQSDRTVLSSLTALLDERIRLLHVAEQERDAAALECNALSVERDLLQRTHESGQALIAELEASLADAEAARENEAQCRATAELFSQSLSDKLIAESKRLDWILDECLITHLESGKNFDQQNRANLDAAMARKG